MPNRQIADSLGMNSAPAAEPLGNDGRGVCSQIVTMASRVRSLRSEAASSPARGYHRRYFQDAARTDEAQICAYANALLSGNFSSRIVSRFEAA